MSYQTPPPSPINTQPINMWHSIKRRVSYHGAPEYSTKCDIFAEDDGRVIFR